MQLSTMTMTITVFLNLQIPLHISATQVVGMREKEQESRERCHEVPVEACLLFPLRWWRPSLVTWTGCIMGIQGAHRPKVLLRDHGGSIIPWLGPTFQGGMALGYTLRFPWNWGGEEFRHLGIFVSLKIGLDFYQKPAIWNFVCPFSPAQSQEMIQFQWVERQLVWIWFLAMLQLLGLKGITIVRFRILKTSYWSSMGLVDRVWAGSNLQCLT